MPTPQILLTGATGYVGGTILTNLLNSSSPTLRSATITCLVRGADRAATLNNTYNNSGGDSPRVRAIVYADLDDLEATTAAAAQADLVINAALGFHAASALALLQGLAQRKARTGNDDDVWLLHLSGTSNVADRALSGAWTESKREFDDGVDDVYAWEKRVEAAHPYVQRGAELAVVDAGLELGVKTLVVMPPTIYGRGTGLFNRQSVQVPAYVKAALARGRPVVMGEGKGAWDHVHVEDLAELYELLVVEVLERSGAHLPTGKNGIIFSANGRHSWLEVAEAVAEVCCEEGRIKDTQVESVGVPEGTRIFAEAYLGHADEEMVELGLASNGKTIPSVAKRLGWKPTRGHGEWMKGLREDIRTALETHH
ncbi:Nad dependent epimerase dehydratase family protein [Lasiodiplodia theobromae]|uniref:Nad dependent epimerase dehydratase family protein n=1 Tax=Lasiodiplodia theobromae TaxID=45133 RepID=UPI0015C31287|nr:Nad dependent epimerase dehydratase family protein [Lasiodiplodia theobromae]KAF4536897.1 Nad dependent epimerase dehydratase family protein [Lasiodiplodia theobromae]